MRDTWADHCAARQIGRRLISDPALVVFEVDGRRIFAATCRAEALAMARRVFVRMALTSSWNDAMYRRR